MGQMHLQDIRATLASLVQPKPREQQLALQKGFRYAGAEFEVHETALGQGRASACPEAPEKNPKALLF